MVTSLSMEIVRIYTDGSEDNGQFVKCNDCGELQLISESKKICEKCASKNLTWVNEELKIASPEDLQDRGYELEFVI